MTATPPHLCVGPSCWTCGEPTEIRQLRQYEVLSALHQLAQDHPDADHHRQARAAMDALRPTLMRWLHAEADLRETRQQLAARDAENTRLRAELTEMTKACDAAKRLAARYLLAARTPTS
ncbi:hypothetical protein ACGFZP_12905 [Kitasatospora sp. NPDC048239]|uniref:hypothetical protein n=1 Tax=Kitasatospora sp. NPDC048239 TaxID=3364046 RepID=UPI003717A797